MKRIFLLDDSIKRVERLVRLFQPHQVTHSASAEEAIVILTNEKFDLICLDHDLTEDYTHWLASGNGLEVAEFLGKHHTPNDHSLILVHTMNPQGGDLMMLALQHRRAQRSSIIELSNPHFVRALFEK